MGFILLLALSALAVAGSAAFFSVYGLGQIFSASFIPVVIMGSSLEVGKLVAASYLYRYWTVTPKLIKAYLFTAVFMLVVITSMGIFGFLTAAYQKDSISLKQQQEQIALYEGQKQDYRNRLEGINMQIEEVPSDYITKRMELITKFAPEKEDVINKINDIDEKLLELKTVVLQTEAKIGPIIYVAEVLDQDPNKATFWFVLMIVGVFDPLAVSLTLATNIALKRRREDKEKANTDKQISATVENVKEDAVEAIREAVEAPQTPQASETDTNPIPTFENEIKEIKRLIRDSDRTQDVERLYNALETVVTEVKKSNIRNQLNKMPKNSS